jgi:hypothetical protein
MRVCGPDANRALTRFSGFATGGHRFDPGTLHSTRSRSAALDPGEDEAGARRNRGTPAALNLLEGSHARGLMTLEYRDPKAVVDEISAVWRLFLLTDNPPPWPKSPCTKLAEQEALNTVGLSWRPWRRGRAWKGGPIFEAHTLAAFTQYKEWAEGWFEAHPWPPDPPAEHVDPQAFVEGAALRHLAARGCLAKRTPRGNLRRCASTRSGPSGGSRHIPLPSRRSSRGRG